MLDEHQKIFVRRQTSTLMGLALQMECIKNRLYDELPEAKILEDSDLKWLLNNVSPEAIWFRMKLQIESDRRKS